MVYKRFITAAAFILLIGISMINTTGCANIIPPQGGPKDSIPPLLIKTTPGDSTRNFKSSRISFSFDEFVDIQNVQENLLVSPIPKINPAVEVRLNTIIVKLKDSLEANTTYTLNFGSAIKDYNEGNVLKDFTYTFSTGPYIDSLELRGNVILAETGKVDTTLIVMLHSSPNDSVVVNEKPRYIAKLDPKGTFVFKNLPPKTFYLFALKDEGGSRRYFNDSQLFGFTDSAINVSGENKPVTIYAYAVKKESQTGTSLPGFNPGNKQRPGGIAADRRLKYLTNLANNQQDILSNFTMTFEQPLRLFDTMKIRLYTDSAFVPVPAYSFYKDSSNKKVTLTTTWKENTLYHLILDKEFAEDSTGKALLKTDTLSFFTKKLDDYGSVKLKFRNLALDKNPVLLFVLNGNVTNSFPLTGPDFSQTLFQPGEYELRILYDENKNGVWDPGVFFGKHKQPEIVKPIERKININPNATNEFELAL